MIPRSLLQRALGFVPSRESIEKRDLYLIDGNLIFIGIASYFLVKNFIRSAANLRLSLSDLKLMIDLGDDLEIDNIDPFTIRARSGTNSLTFPAYRVEEFDHKEIVVLPDAEYGPIPPVFTYGRDIFNSVNEYTAVCALPIGERNCLMLYQSSTLVVLHEAKVKEREIEMDLSQLPSLISSAVRLHARVAIHKSWMYFKASFDTNELYAGVKYPYRHSIPERPRATVASVMNGEMTNPENHAIINVTVQASELKEKLAISNKLRPRAQIRVNLKETSLDMDSKDSMGREYKASISCVSTGVTRFSMMNIPAQLIEFLCSVSTVNDPRIEMIINTTINLMIIRTHREDAGETTSLLDAFVLRPIRVVTGI